MTKKIIILGLVFLFISPLVSAQESESNLNLEWGKLDGETSYTISGPQQGGFKSELVFPLETKFIRLNYGQKLSSTPLGINKINLSFMKNLDTENNGTMEDSDWLYNWHEQKKAIYSETKADLEAESGKVEFLGREHYYNENINYYFKSGYRYRNFDYNVHDGIQYNYKYDIEQKIKGKVLEYEVEYHIPYLGVKFRNRKKNKINWESSLDIAPYVKAEDIDDHILRYKKSTGETEGGALMFNSSLEYNLKPNFILSVAGSYTKIATDGHQDQYFYDGKYEGDENKNIDQTIDLESYKVSVSLNYLF